MASDKRLRVGDVVSVTARVVGLRGDGSVLLEPVGFDYDAVPDGTQMGVDVEFYSVDQPTLVQRGLQEGDEKFNGDGIRFVYARDLGEGMHLMNRPDVQQDCAFAWEVMTLEQVEALADEPPQLPSRR